MPTVKSHEIIRVIIASGRSRRGSRRGSERSWPVSPKEGTGACGCSDSPLMHFDVCLHESHPKKPTQSTRDQTVVSTARARCQDMHHYIALSLTQWTLLGDAGAQVGTALYLIISTIIKCVLPKGLAAGTLRRGRHRRAGRAGESRRHADEGDNAANRGREDNSRAAVLAT